MPGWLENYPQYHVQAFDPNEWCPKNSLLSGGLNPGPLSPESCALTTRPRLLILVSYIVQVVIHFIIPFTTNPGYSKQIRLVP